MSNAILVEELNGLTEMMADAIITEDNSMIAEVELEANTKVSGAVAVRKDDKELKLAVIRLNTLRFLARTNIKSPRAKRLARLNQAKQAA